MNAGDHHRTLEVLRPVLAEVRFPARRWEILTAADLYGIDPSTRGLLQDLPERGYDGLDQIATELSARRAIQGRTGSRDRRAAAVPTTRHPVPDPRHGQCPEPRAGAPTTRRSSQ